MLAHLNLNNTIISFEDLIPAYRMVDRFIPQFTHHQTAVTATDSHYRSADVSTVAMHGIGDTTML
jgi:hypothetical protein